MKPLWLLDIDGVVNAVPFSGKAPEVWPAWIRKDVGNTDGTWPILAATAVLDFLTEVHETGLAEIRWHTTWQEEALNVGDALGLPTFHIQPCPEATRNTGIGWWKLHTVIRELEVGQAVLWTDDDIFDEVPKRTRRFLGGFSNFLAVVPDPVTGLTYTNLKEIREFLEENQ